MGRTVRVAGCQLPDVRADVETALSHLVAAAQEADERGVALLVTPECFLQGYLLPEALTLRLALEFESAEFRAILGRLEGARVTLVVGLVERRGAALFNTAAVIRRGQLLGTYRKNRLLRSEACFAPGTEFPVFEVAGLRFGINICYDLRFSECAAAVAAQGADLLVAPCNNMLERRAAESWKHRHHALRAERVRETGLWLVSADVCGQRDDKISYGPTEVLDLHGTAVVRVPLQEVGMAVWDVPCREPGRTGLAR